MPTETEISHFRQEWINVFQEQNENLLANEIEDLDNLELVNDEDRFQELKNAATSLKAEEYLKTFREEIRELFGLKRDEFPIDKYKDLNKTDIARKMADYAVATYGIRPTDIGELQEETQLYQYNPATGTWEYFSKNKLGRLCKKMGDTEYTDHLEREFTRNLVNHGTFQRLENMGTNANELAIKEGKKLILEDIENKDITELETESIQRSDQALHSINADYEPGAECPRFQELVQQLLDNRPEQIDTLQEFLGWMLKFPDRTHKKALLILGVTNSGKSQLTEIVELMFEKERGKTVTNVSLPQIGFHRRFHINKLQNSIVNIDKDLSSGKIDDAANIKTVTAQEKMNIEPKGQDSYEIQPNAKFLIAANTSPEIENQDDEAYYGRFLTLKAPNTVPKEDRVKDLGKKIFEEEANGILNWMLEGLKRLEKRGDFSVNPSPVETKRMWMEFGDSISRFLWEVCEITRDVNEDVVPKDDLYEHYLNWTEDRMEEKITEQKFYYRINDNPLITTSRKRINGVQKRCVCGLKVKKEELYGEKID